MNLSELKKIATEATPGLWVKSEVRNTGDYGQPEGLCEVVVHEKEHGFIICNTSPETEWVKNGEFIATFNPQTALKLIELLEEAEKVLNNFEPHMKEDEYASAQIEARAFLDKIKELK